MIKPCFKLCFFVSALFVFFVLCRAPAAPVSSLISEVKMSARQLLSTVFMGVSADSLKPLPDGFKILEGKTYRGFSVEQGKLLIRVHTWGEASGLLENYFVSKEAGLPIIAAVNGTFYSSRGALGQVVSDSAIPVNIFQSPGSLSRCFLVSFRGEKGNQTWYLGETCLSGRALTSLDFKYNGWFNTAGKIYAVRADHLLGGGGWLLRGRKDVHREAFDRQRFRFKREALTARKTVIAQDSERRLYFLVFDSGLTFHQAAKTFVKDPVFSKVQDAIFLDGGSSSEIVIKGKYFVPPLYLVDKARYTCIQILLPEIAQ